MVGNSGCCDCGDDEVWKMLFFCMIYFEVEVGGDKGKGKEVVGLLDDFVGSI